MRVGDFNFDNFSLEEKSYENSYENIPIYDISHKTSLVARPLCIRFNKVDGFINIYDETR